MTKLELRDKYKEKRLQLSADLLLVYEVSIIEKLRALRIPGASLIHIYLPIGKWKEFDTFPYIDWLRKERPDVSIVISKTEFETGILKHYLFEENVEISTNIWGIPEPIMSSTLKEVDPLLIDYVIVPLLTCDRRGNRVGYGKGFYDRFLLQCRPDVCKIGVSHFPPLQQLIEADPWDIPLDKLVCPQNIVEFRSDF